MTTARGTALDRLLSAGLVLSLLLILVSSVLFTAFGWQRDPAGAVVAILGGMLGILVVLRVVTWFPANSRLAAVALLVGTAGVAGNVGYGFDAIEVSRGVVSLVDLAGAATVIKPLGLCWPLALLLLGVGLLRTRVVPIALGALVVVGALLFPVSRVANIGWLAITADVLLLAGFGAAVVLRRAPTDEAALRASGSAPTQHVGA